jgi:hypothetical protein
LGRGLFQRGEVGGGFFSKEGESFEGFLLKKKGTLPFSPPLEKGDEGGFEVIKSPLGPLFQRGGSWGGSFPKRWNLGRGSFSKRNKAHN